MLTGSILLITLLRLVQSSLTDLVQIGSGTRHGRELRSAGRLSVLSGSSIELGP